MGGGGGESDIPHPGMTPLSPSELLPLRETDGPEKGSKTGTIQRLQIRGSTKNIATGSEGDRKREEKRDRECWELKKRQKKKKLL